MADINALNAEIASVKGQADALAASAATLVNDAAAAAARVTNQPGTPDYQPQVDAVTAIGNSISAAQASVTQADNIVLAILPVPPAPTP